MPVTLTAVAAGLGAVAGDGDAPAEVVAAVEEALGARDGANASVSSACGAVLVLVRHESGEDEPQLHARLWEALRAGAAVATERGLHLAGRDLLADALPTGGLIGDAGPSVAELTFEPRAVESVVVLVAPAATVGSLNGALYRAFADPLHTAGLVHSPAMQAGFAFEVHDLRERRKAVFQTPAEAYALLAYLGAASRYVAKRVASVDTGALAAATSTQSGAQLLGGRVAGDAPLALVRCQGVFPTVGDLIEPFATPLMATGIGAAGNLGPLIPTPAGAALARDLPAAPVAALAYQLGPAIEGPRDLFADTAFDAARARARALAETLRRQGPVEPHRALLEESEALSPVAAATLADRWTALDPPAVGADGS